VCKLLKEEYINIMIEITYYFETNNKPFDDSQYDLIDAFPDAEGSCEILVELINEANREGVSEIVIVQKMSGFLNFYVDKVFE
jgi:hypothetical protein